MKNQRPKHLFTINSLVLYIILIIILSYLLIIVTIYNKKKSSEISNPSLSSKPRNQVTQSQLQTSTLHPIDINNDNNTYGSNFRDVRGTERKATEKYRGVEYIINREGCVTDMPTIDHGPHIVPPPPGPVTLVCCNTTKGPLSIAVHRAWAPIGADNFINMVESHFFSSEVPLFRALKGFLVQFGISGDPDVQQEYERRMRRGKGFLEDDPHWLPLGPPGREINGSYRFQKGYMAYAGGGKNSRGTQLIMAFDRNMYLGGGSPWEVPWGQVVGPNSLQTLDSIYTGYHEKPSQGKIRNRGKSYTMLEFPKLDYMTSCNVIRRNVPWVYKPLKTS